MVNLFAYKPASLWFAYHPLYAAGKFTYPFLPDMVSGLLVRLGIPITAAIIVPSILISELLVLGLYLLAFRLLKSRTQALLSVTVFFMSAGLGGFRFFQDLFKGFSWSKLIHPSTDFTSFPNFDWYSGNVVDGLLIPQRGFLFGMTFGIWALLIFLYSLESKRSLRHRRIGFVVSGCLAGILPIVHIHSLIAILPAFICLAVWKKEKWKDWIWCAIPAGLITCLLYFVFISGGIEKKGFVHFSFGWRAGNPWEWLRYCFLFWGAALPLSALSLWKIKGQKKFAELFWMSIGFIFSFVVANSILFQPVYWDNSKLFFWCYALFAILAVQFLASWANSKKQILRVSAYLLFVSLVFSGGIDLYRILAAPSSYQLTSMDDFRLGVLLRERTPPLARILTGTSNDNFVMTWAVRPILLGFTPWVDNFGFVYQQTESDLHRMYEAKEDITPLLNKYQIRYVLIGPGERLEFHANSKYFGCRYPIAFQNSQFKIYDLSQTITAGPDCHEDIRVTDRKSGI